MTFTERRAEKRVRPPRDAVLDFALWPAEANPPMRLPLAALGPPSARHRPGQRLELVDVASLGIGLRLFAEPSVLAGLAAGPALFVYLRLHAYAPLDAAGPLSLFVHAATVRADAGQGETRFGLRILHLGRGSTFEKAIELLDVSRFGVRELAAWIDAVDRHGHRRETGMAEGLDIEALLAEPDLADQGCPTGEGNGA
ncbi:MAG: hypothetical protein AAGU21_06840 [Solidesulfovibrio sp.]|uniref:hypothetical protein n=1 Tax=Solidesulfovibrio sp. TaxID=2910990 RepID=UPI002B1EDA99|nr:hypothetical protein [Solidesulfovibrio sp.]MEA4856479.1 hypothetical protein [Solidesulfovibrio sp.]